MSTDCIDVYTDAGVIRANPSPYGGTWAYLYVRDGAIIRRQSGLLTPEYGIDGTHVTNNVTELYALCLALQEYNYIDMPFTVYCDSAVAMQRVFGEDRPTNWIPDWLRDLLRRVRIKVGILNPAHVLLKGHPSKAELAAGVAAGGAPVSRYNVYCDTLCTKEAEGFILSRAEGDPLTAQVRVKGGS